MAPGAETAARAEAGTPCAARSASLLLVAHGSRTGAAAAADALVAALARDFREVAFSVLCGPPSPRDVLGGLSGDVVHVVPLLMAAGEAAGRLLGALPAVRNGLRVHAPIGGHPALARMVGERIERSIADNRCAAADTAVLLVGHGNARNPAAAQAVHRLGSVIRARGCGAAEVHCAFLSQPPLVQDWRQMTCRRNVIVVPCLLTLGRHAQFDLPKLLQVPPGEPLAQTGRLWVTAPLAADWPGLAEVVRRVVDSSARPPNGRRRTGPRPEPPSFS